jgi:5-methylcytosine-specific restriction endonuclease McrA
MKPTYQELLMSPDWQEKRKTILLRDENLCQECLNDKLVEGLQVDIAQFPKKVNQKIVYILEHNNVKRELWIPYQEDFPQDDLFVFTMCRVIIMF